MLNCLTLMSSVRDITLFETFVTSYGPFHLFLFSRYTRTYSPARMRQVVAVGSLLLSAVLIRFSATVVSTSTHANLNAAKILVCVVCKRDGAGNVGIVPYASKEYTDTLGPILSFMDFIEILSIIFSSSCRCVC